MIRRVDLGLTSRFRAVRIFHGQRRAAQTDPVDFPIEQFGHGVDSVVKRKANARRAAVDRENSGHVMSLPQCV